MTSDRDIYASAKQYIEQYGNKAYVMACIRAGELQAKRDLAGATTFLRIADAIQELRATKGVVH